MARAAINRGTTAGDGTGETAFSAFGKVNDNFVELYTGFVGKDNVATTDPGVGNDGTQGYAAGSSWFNSSTGILWWARSVATGAALWIPQQARIAPTPLVNRWYHTHRYETSLGQASYAGEMWFYPYVPENSFTASEVAVRVQTAIAGSNFQLAVYASDPTSQEPDGTALATTTNMSGATVGVVSNTLSANVSFVAGRLYWLGSNASAAGIRWTSFSTGNTESCAIFGTSVVGDLFNFGYSLHAYRTVQSFGTWPDVTSASWNQYGDTSFPTVGYKVASVP
jgi:hypothetical protein